MNSHQFKALRVILGLTAQDVATANQVTLRTAQRWETTHTPPQTAQNWLHGKIDRLNHTINKQQPPDPTLTTGERTALLGHTYLHQHMKK